MSALLKQLKKRRITLGLKQKDMILRVGMSRQQYNRLETKGNPRLDTLELIAKGLNSELMLIPQEKLNAVREILENEKDFLAEQSSANKESNTFSDDPWKGLLEDDEQ
ncbi:helix-turn-helix transcriptional regulator [Methylophaga muralis]|uniref:Helix-turn-helix protein n=1 Tax=Methylophaga muralis TaxID=291169 RepID=A0A1E3GPI7_9GAMM|nr:helix-turn-helix transcriptional regulator [Methylophaga muralis]ODN65972.1 helix-turn-helix protein [Methylophaga muralis]